MKNTAPTPQVPTAAQRTIASIALGGLLIQIFLFYIGLLDPVRRAASLWGKNLEDRRAVVWQPGRVLMQIAEQFPLNAKIYIDNPQPLIHWNSVYYFYPRIISASMTNSAYRTDGDYAKWNEHPTREWLLQNDFDYVMSFTKEGLSVKPVKSGLQGNGTSR